MKKWLVEKAEDKSNLLVSSSLFEIKYEVKSNIYDELPMVENVIINEIEKYESSIFIFTRDNGINDLNKVFGQFIRSY